MGYRTLTRAKAIDMAYKAGLTKKRVYNCHFRELMAEHAVKLLIALSLKDKRKDAI